jgi:hypothetical protein
VIRSSRVHLAAIALFVIAVVPRASQAASPAQTIRGLVGRWTCVTDDTDHKTWHAIAEDKMYGPWLQMTSTFPDQNGQKAGTSVKFLGFDSNEGRWIVTSVDSSGVFYVIDSKSRTFDGSHWQDVYPADRGTASVRVQSSSEYTFDASLPSGGGHAYASHTICERV